MASNSIQVIQPGPSAGQAFGRGLVDTLQPILEREQQLNQTRRAIQGIRDKSQNASPIDQLYNIIEASSVSPEIGRSSGALYEQLMKSEQTGKFFGNQGQGTSRGQPQQQGPAQNLQPQQQGQQYPINLQVSGGGIPTTMQGQGEPVAGQPRPGPYTSSGVLPAIMTADEIDARAREAAQIQNDPSSLPGWQQYFSNQNELNRKARGEAENALLNSGLDQTEIPEAMEIGKQFSGEKDLNKWVIDTKNAYDKYKNSMDKLENADIPGFFRGVMQGPKARETALERMTGTVQDLIKAGKESYVRAFLAKEDLSPTEIEEAIHPLTERSTVSLDKLKKGIFPANKREVDLEQKVKNKDENPFVDYETAKEKAPNEMKAMQARLANFFKNSVDNDTSLLVLRHKLWNEKDYDWRQIGPAIREAMGKGLKLNPSQLAELAEVETQAPRQSISDVFNNWGRWQDYFRGAK